MTEHDPYAEVRLLIEQQRAAVDELKGQLEQAQAIIKLFIEGASRYEAGGDVIVQETVLKGAAFLQGESVPLTALPLEGPPQAHRRSVKDRLDAWAGSQMDKLDS